MPDTVHMKDGRSYSGTAEVKGEVVMITSYGNRTIVASSSRIGFRRAYLIAIRLLNLLCSILPSCSISIQRIRSRGVCERLIISRIATNV